jgi:hypothetical protein
MIIEFEVLGNTIYRFMYASSSQNEATTQLFMVATLYIWHISPFVWTATKIILEGD